jgi:hypothetical protein
MTWDRGKIFLDHSFNTVVARDIMEYKLIKIILLPMYSIQPWYF